MHDRVSIPNLTQHYYFTTETVIRDRTVLLAPRRPKMRIRIQSNLYNESLRLGTRALALFWVQILTKTKVKERNAQKQQNLTFDATRCPRNVKKKHLQYFQCHSPLFVGFACQVNRSSHRDRPLPRRTPVPSITLTSALAATEPSDASSSSCSKFPRAFVKGTR